MSFDPTTQFAVFYQNSVNIGSTVQPILDQSIISTDAIAEEEQGAQQFDRMPWYSIFQTGVLDSIRSLLTWIVQNIFVEWEES